MMDEFLGLSTARAAMSVSESHPPESNIRASSHRSCSAQFRSSAFRKGSMNRAKGDHSRKPSRNSGGSTRELRRGRTGQDGMRYEVVVQPVGEAELEQACRWWHVSPARSRSSGCAATGSLATELPAPRLPWRSCG